MDAALTADVRLTEGQAMAARDFTRSAYPFVAVDLADGALTLFLRDVATVDRLIEVATQARMLLVAAAGGEVPDPIIRPIANPYLTPGPLPIGVA
jgi:hypothetical protein